MTKSNMSVEDLLDKMKVEEYGTIPKSEVLEQLYELLISEAKNYDLVTHDFGTPQVVATAKAIPLEAINQLFGRE